MSPSRRIRCTIVASALASLAAACSGGPGTPSGIPSETREPAASANDPSNASGGDPLQASTDSAGCACTGGTYSCVPLSAAAGGGNSQLTLAASADGCDIVGSKGQSQGQLLCDGTLAVDGVVAPSSTWRPAGTGALTVCVPQSAKDPSTVCFDCAIQSAPRPPTPTPTPGK